MVQKRPEITLLIDGEEYKNWISYQIESDMLTPSDAFSLTASNKNGEMAGKVYPGSRCKVLVDDEVVLMGYVDAVTYDGDEQPQVEIAGRDDFCFLVDCSAVATTYDMTLLDLAKKLSEAWISSSRWSVQSGITLSKKSVKVQPGETVWEVLDRQARKLGLLIWYTADGHAVIGKPDYTSAPVHAIRRYKRTSKLHVHNSAIKGRVEQNWTETYDSIHLGGDGTNSDSRHGSSARFFAAAVRDGDSYIVTNSRTEAASYEANMGSAIRRLIMEHGDVKDNADAKRIVKEEYTRRERDSEVLLYTAKGHYGVPADPSGTPSLYQPNQRIGVVDEQAGLSVIRWCASRRFTMSEEGQFTELRLLKEGWLA